VRFSQKNLKFFYTNEKFYLKALQKLNLKNFKFFEKLLKISEMSKMFEKLGEKIKLFKIS